MKTPQAFSNAVKSLQFPPPSTEQFWDVWQDRAAPRRIGRDIMAVLMSAYPGYLRVLVFGGVAGIESADYLRQFCPEVLLFPPRDARAPTPPLVQWLKSNQGYVDEPMKIITADETGQ